MNTDCRKRAELNETQKRFKKNKTAELNLQHPTLTTQIHPAPYSTLKAMIGQYKTSDQSNPAAYSPRRVKRQNHRPYYATVER